MIIRLHYDSLCSLILLLLLPYDLPLLIRGDKLLCVFQILADYSKLSRLSGFD